MTTTHIVNLLLSNLPPKARLSHQLPGFVNNLLSVAVLCSGGCKVFFHKTGCKVTFNGKTILRGWCDPKNYLWHVMIVDDDWTAKVTIHNFARPIIPLSTTPTGHLVNSMPIVPSESNTALANSLYKCYNTGQLINYYYACLNYLIKSTLTKAIDRGYLKSWWGLTSQQTCCHISVSTESEMGHMDQQCQGVQSAQPTPTTMLLQVPSSDNPMEDVPQEPHNARTHFIFMAIYEINGNLFTNQTGRFPITSNHGHAYVAVFYIFDANAIQSVPIKNRSKEELHCAYYKIYKWLTHHGFKPLLHKLDNKTSKDVKAFVATEQTCIQYTPPDIHCTNPAKRAIRTWKNHFLAGMAGLPKSFPIANWCCLTMHCDATLNMLCPCCQNPLLSAHEALEGSFSFNATPMAPLGTEVLIHMKPNLQRKWGYHASKAWCVLHAANHYCCIQVLMANKGGERITNTFHFKHHAIPVPEITATNRIIDVTKRLPAAITGIQDAPPDKMEAIQSFCTLLLGKVAPLPPPTPSILPTPPPPTPVVDEDKPVII
jgi:hypothetical protein